MGLFDLFTQSAPKTEQVDVAAANFMPFEPYNISSGISSVNSIAQRWDAVAIPSLNRARGIICSTIASLPKEQYVRATGAHVEPNRCLNQPDPRIPGSVVYAWLAEDIWLHGFGYGMIMDYYSDGRISAWTRIAFQRVTPQYNDTMTEVVSYLVDGYPVPVAGRGSLIVFAGLDEGLLNKAGRTIRAALWLERAAENYAKNPVPSTVLKSNGSNLTAERIRALIQSWTKSRQDNSTAFLNADVNIEVLGFDPAKLQLNEARQYVALEIARHCGIPAYFLSAEQTSMTYSNAISERKSLVDFSLRPILAAIEERLSMSDFVPQNTVVRHDLDDFLRGDPLQRAQVYEILNRIGAMSVAQIQEEEDLIDNA
jgi:HK97 family phage portal protein